MENFQFLVLATLTDRVLVDSACSLLEEQGIPVLLEHIHISGAHTSNLGGGNANPSKGKNKREKNGSLEEQADGIRLLVPSEHADRALHMLKAYLIRNKQSISGNFPLSH